MSADPISDKELTSLLRRASAIGKLVEDLDVAADLIDKLVEDLDVAADLIDKRRGVTTDDAEPVLLRDYHVDIYRPYRTTFRVMAAESQEAALRRALAIPVAEAVAVVDAEGPPTDFIVDTVDSDTTWSGELDTNGNPVAPVDEGAAINTYARLRKWLDALTPEQLAMNITIYHEATDWYVPAADADLAIGSDVIDDGHPVIVID